MDTNFEDGRGLVKVYWPDVRERVAKVEPSFAKHIDNLSIDKTFPIYLAYYPYGAIEADTQSSLFPREDGGFYRLTDSDAPKDVYKNLSYSINSAPLGMVLSKQLELFIDRKNEGITIPWLVYTPGMFFPFAAILSIKHHRTYAPNGILSSTAGARSVFMLPNIGCTTSHSTLQRDLIIKCQAPRSIYDHWNIFKEIAKANSNWRCCVMPTYYSLQYPTTHIFSPKSREVTNILYELRKLEHIMHVFIDELSIENAQCSDTVVGEIAKNIEFKYYHSKFDRYGVVNMTNEVAKLDARFTSIPKKFKRDTAVFATDAPFLRGCISISRK